MTIKGHLLSSTTIWRCCMLCS